MNAECYLTIGPLCFASELRFYLWALSQIAIWGAVIIFNIWLWRRK